VFDLRIIKITVFVWRLIVGWLVIMNWNNVQRNCLGLPQKVPEVAAKTHEVSQYHRSSGRNFNFLLWRYSQNVTWGASFLRFIDHTHLDTLGRFLVNDWSARLSGRYLQNTQYPWTHRDLIPWFQQSSGYKPVP